jgi:hypothetical protein
VSYLSGTKADRSFNDKLLIKMEAWAKGKNPWISWPNSDPQARNKPFVRVRANSIWGDPRIGWFFVGKKEKGKVEIED